MTRLIFVLILCAAVNRSTSWTWTTSILPLLISTKVWVSYTNQSWRDWNTRLGLGEINFPTNLEAPLAFPTASGTGCELIIPMDDVLNDEEFLQSPPAPACPKDAHTLPEEEVLWINPDNWRPGLIIDVNPAVPHIERIPCAYDNIRFNMVGDFIVILPNKNISIRRMAYDGGYIANFNFKSMLKKESFVRHFVVHGAHDVTELLSFTENDCPDVTGCVCGTMQFYEDICAIMKPKCNLTLTCFRPIKPEGHCCSMCGVSVQIRYDPKRFVMKKLYTAIYNKLKDEVTYYNWHLSKLSDGIAQLIFVGRDEFDTRDVYAGTEDLIRSLLELDNMGIITYTITSSGSVSDPKMWYNAIRPALFILGSAALLIVGYFLCTNKNTKFFHHFAKKTAKFEKLNSTIEENNLQDEQAEKTEESRCENGNPDETAESGAESESDDVFRELRAASEGEDSPSSSRSKEFEDVEILLDIPGSESGVVERTLGNGTA